MRKSVSYENFLHWLRAQSKAAGSQHAFALRMGVSSAYLSDVLNGRRMPSQRFLAAVGARIVSRYEIDAA